MEVIKELNILSTLIPFALIVFIIAIGVVVLNQQFRNNLHKQILEKETLKIQHQDQLLQTVVTVQEDERKRIARDLHDELGAALSISRMMLVQLEQTYPEGEDKVIQIREIIESTLASTRRISHELMPLNLENLGLEKALKSLGNRIEATGALKTNVAITGLPNKPFWLLELGLYRILSELINNTLKYAEATEIDIRIIPDDLGLVCTYQDNGKGLTENGQKNGLGFISVESRVNMLKGTWEYGNGIHGGFHAQLKLPFTVNKTT